MRVFVADNHPIVRAGLRSIAERGGHLIVGEADDDREILRRVETAAPEIVLLDLTLPARGGVPGCAELLHRLPALKVLVLAHDESAHLVSDAFNVGALGCLSHRAGEPELLDALATVGRGERFASCVPRARPAPGPSPIWPGLAPSIATLTERQREVLRLLAHGQSTKEAAAQLGLSSKTVDVHRAQIMRKLDLHSIQALVLYALRTGLLEAGTPMA